MNPALKVALFAILTTILASVVYFLILAKIKPGLNHKTGTRLIVSYIWRKLIGVILFGIIPGFLAWILFGQDPARFGFKAGSSLALWPWLAGAAVFFITLNFFNSKNLHIQSVYPELRLRRWNFPAILIEASGWIMYLTAYEFMFRGLLLWSCYNAFGLWPAVAVNLVIYFAQHIPKGMKEAVATLPFGALVIYLTLQSHSILPAILIHSLQAISNEMFCVYRNPAMHFIFTKTRQP